MQVFLVKTSTGEWEDTAEMVDSIWSKEEDAQKRISILKHNNELNERLKNLCWSCPVHQLNCGVSKEELLKASRDYCKEYCCGKGKPYIFDEENYSVECDESSANYHSVTVYSPEVCDLDNTELLKDGSRSSN